MATYFSSNLEDNIEGKWLLWDTCAIIRVVEVEGVNLFEDLISKGVKEHVTIKPVKLELSATKSQKDAVKRTNYLEEGITTILRTNINDGQDMTLKVQQNLPSSAQPGAVDLMLASTLTQYSDNMLMITENIKDFPEPLFKKEGFVVVTSHSRTSALTLLSVNVKSLL